MQFLRKNEVKREPWTLHLFFSPAQGWRSRFTQAPGIYNTVPIETGGLCIAICCEEMFKTCVWFQSCLMRFHSERFRRREAQGEKHAWTANLHYFNEISDAIWCKQWSKKFLSNFEVMWHALEIFWCYAAMASLSEALRTAHINNKLIIERRVCNDACLFQQP